MVPQVKTAPRILLLAALLLSAAQLGIRGNSATLRRSGGVAPSSTTFDVRRFGARGDGHHNDTPALHAALLAAERAHGGTVHFPPGTYIIDPASGPFLADSDVTFLGSGPRSVLRVKNDAGQYNLIFGQVPHRIRHVAFRHFRVDQNPAGNHISDINPSTDAENVVQLYDFDGVAVEDVAFDPEPGVQAIVLAGPHARNATIAECVFQFQRGHTSNPFYDNSSVYTESGNVAIRGNRFLTTNAQNAVTAIEVHGGPSIEIAQNEAVEFQVGLNVVNSTSGYPDVRVAHVVVHDNALLQTTQAFALWSVSGRTLRGVDIDHNDVTMQQHLQYRNAWLGLTFVRGPRSLGIDGDFSDLRFSHNTVDFSPLRAQDIAPSLAIGIDVAPKGTLRGFRATDDTLLGSPLTGVRLGYAGGGSLKDVTLEDNRIIDAAWSVRGPSRARAAVALERAPMHGVHVDRNLILLTGRYRSFEEAFSAWAHPLRTSSDVTLRYDRIQPHGVMRYSIDRKIVDDRGTIP